MIIAVDFDGTLFTEGAYPFVGEPIMRNIETVKQFIECGHRIILWTCRDGEPLQRALSACEEYGINLVAVNTNDPASEWSGPQSNKIYADYYFDDRNIYGREDLINGLCRKDKEGCIEP